MAYNTAFTRFKSGELAGLDCGNYLKIPRRQGNIDELVSYTGDLEVGQCAAMVRVPAGARIVAAELTWGHRDGGSGTSVLAVGDPYACGRLIGPAVTLWSSGAQNVAGAGAPVPWGQCGRMTKTGALGDGCGMFYQYTCETDIVVTNLYSEGNAAAGGYAGGGFANAGTTGAKWTGGRITLRLVYKQQS